MIYGLGQEFKHFNSALVQQFRLHAAYVPRAIVSYGAWGKEAHAVSPYLTIFMSVRQAATEQVMHDQRQHLISC